MQELLGRIARLDPSASLGLRVIACFDELVVGNVNTRALLACAASLAACPAGFRAGPQRPSVRVGPDGQVLADPGDDRARTERDCPDGMVVWLEREGQPQPNDDLILERLALAVRLRHGRDQHAAVARRDVGVVLDGEASEEDRRHAATELGLHGAGEYRVVVAPLFGVWSQRPSGAEDVVPTAFGPVHAVVIAASDVEAVDAAPCGIGAATVPTGLPHSFRTAMVALRLCEPPGEPLVRADDFGGLASLLADSVGEPPLPDLDALREVMEHPWGRATVDAIVRCGSIRQAARQVGVHHSTMQARSEAVAETLGFDPFEGFGRTRLGTAYLVHRLRHSRVVELPPPVPR